MFHEKVKEMFYAENEHFTCLIQKTYTERDLLVTNYFVFVIKYAYIYSHIARGHELILIILLFMNG